MIMFKTGKRSLTLVNLFKAKSWSEFAAQLKINTYMRGRIDPLRNQIEMTLRTKTDFKTQPNQESLSLSAYAVGQKIDAVVKKIESFGVFLRIKNTQISGLCHKTQVGIQQAFGKAYL